MGLPDFVGDIRKIFEEIKELKQDVAMLKRVVKAVREALAEPQ